MSDPDIKKLRHELRGAVAVLKSFLDAIESVDFGDEGIKELYEAARRNVEKIRRVVEGS